MNDERLKDALQSIAHHSVSYGIDLWSQVASRLKKRNTLMQTFRTRPVLVAFLLAFSLLLIVSAAYAIGRLTGFIPGFGFTSGDVYVLESPVEMVQNGTTLRLDNAVYDGSRLWVELTVQNSSMLNDFSQAYLLSSDGERIAAQRGGLILPDENTRRLTFLFSGLDEPSKPVDLLVENLGDETFEIKFMLRPARADEVLPLLPESGLPVIGEMHDGVALALENVAVSSDQTVLQVSLHFEKNGVWLAAPWNVTMTDTDGHIYLLKDITPDTMDIGTTRLYQTTPLQGNEHIILSLVSFPNEAEIPAFMDFSTDPATFTFDPGQSPQAGQTWALGENIQMGEFSLHLVGARMVSPTEFLFTFEPGGDVTGVMLYAADASGAAGGVPVDGNFTAGLTFAEMPKAPFEIQVRSVYYTAHGPWSVEWQASPAVTEGFPTMTPAPSPTPLSLPTLASREPLLLEVQALSEKFDRTMVQGPAWIHAVSENFADNLQPGQTYPPPYYQDEQWSEIDAEGWVTRHLTTHRDADGNILQQAASVGAKSVNFTLGETFEISPYQLSFDLLTRDLDFALSNREQVTREEASCEDGSSCLLVSISNPIVNQKVWINLQTGQQVQFQSSQRLADGTEQSQFTQRFILVERVQSPPQDVLDILENLVTP